MRGWIIVVAGLLMGLAAAPPADPDRMSLTPDGLWQLVRTDSGCSVIRYGDSNYDTWESVRDVRRSWSGGCDSAGLFSGRGVMVSTYRLATDDGGSINFRVETQGAAVGGIFDGPVSEPVYSDAEGPMQLHYFGDGSNPMPEVRRNGCSYMPDGTAWDGCTPGVGPRLSAEVRARGAASYFGGDAGGSATDRPERLQSLADEALPSPAGGIGGSDTGCGSTPAEARSRFDRAFGTLSATYPNPGAAAGVNRQYAYSVFMGERGLPILESYRPCMAEADYQTNLKALTGMRDVGRTGCEATSSTPGQCQAYVP